MTNSTALNFSSLAEMYERVLVEPLFRPWVDDLLQRAAPVAGERLLDVACGTGIVARVARERLGPGARITGVDANPQMLSVASRTAPDIDWREGNAMALPVDGSEQFDVVVCQQGLQFFPDKLAAAREMRRVLAPGGRAVVATWRPLEEVPLMRDTHRIAERHLGTVVDQRHAFGTTAQLEMLLVEAGLRDVRVDVVTRTIRVAEPSALLQMNASALVGMSAAGKAMDERERGRVAALIAAESAELVPRYADGAGFAFELRTNVAVGRA